MKRNAGVWLDNRKAIIVFVDTAGRSLQQIDSGVEGRVRLSGGSRTRKTPFGPQDVVHDSKRDARHQQNLRKYFREIIRTVATVDKLILFGPGEAKLALMKEIEKSKVLSPKVVDIQTTDKMTDKQIAAYARSYYKAIDPVAK